MACQNCGHDRHSHELDGNCHAEQHGAMRHCRCMCYVESSDELNHAIEVGRRQLANQLYQDVIGGGRYRVILVSDSFDVGRPVVVASRCDGTMRFVHIPAETFFKDRARGGIVRLPRFRYVDEK